MTKKLTKEEKAANLAARRAARGADPKAAKKAAKGKNAKVVAIKPRKKAAPGEAGHNSGQVNEALKQIFAEYHEADESAKAISKHKRDLRAKAKEEHGVLASVFNHEIKLQKLDNDARVMFETGHKDVKGMLGIQLALDLAGGGGDDEDQDDDDGKAPDPVDAGRAAAAGGLH